MQGDPPSHPELLDWLAVEFMASGWRVKDLHRLIVTSATYRQQSAASPANSWSATRTTGSSRGARVSAWRGRRSAISPWRASGLLNGRRWAAPVCTRPRRISIFLPPASYGTKTWNYDEGADKYRRALYTFRFRSAPFPALQVFDAPSGEAPCTRRERSNSPLAGAGRP